MSTPATPSAVLNASRTLSPSEIVALCAAWEKRYSGLQSGIFSIHEAPVLGGLVRPACSYCGRVRSGEPTCPGCGAAA